MIVPGYRFRGGTIILTIDVMTKAGTLIDPTALSCITMSPTYDLKTYVFGTDANVSRLSIGKYSCSFVPGESGEWHFRWEASDAAYVMVNEGRFNVQDSIALDGVEPATGAYRL